MTDTIARQLTISALVSRDSVAKEYDLAGVLLVLYGVSDYDLCQRLPMELGNTPNCFLKAAVNLPRLL